jgi:hypothetical protein
MHATTMLSVTVLVLLCSSFGCANRRAPHAAESDGAANPEPVVQPVASGEAKQRISGPYTHENLSVYLIHGPDQVKGVNYLTLQEAMEQKKVIVHETGDVNELAIENVSDEDVYIQSGDVVKGGKQDRTIATDVIAQAHGGRMPIAAFCVEQGRWRRRGGEDDTQFSGGSLFMISGKDTKLASNVHTRAAEQSAVWDAVAENQRKLSRSVGGSVSSSESPSSLQLAMENVADDTAPYCDALRKSVEGKDDVIGWAYAVNGKISGANVYGSGALFRKLWPKLLQSGATEALAEKEEKTEQAPAAAPSVAEVQSFLAAAEQTPAKPNRVNERTTCSVYDANDSVLLATDDERAGGTVHRSYIRK